MKGQAPWATWLIVLLTALGAAAPARPDETIKDSPQACPTGQAVAANEYKDSPQAYKVGQRSVRLVPGPAHHTLVDEDCARRPTRCAALLALPRASFAGLGSSFRDGTNPGALVCQKLGGDVVMSLDSRGNQNTLCLFSDGSLISNGSLAYRAGHPDRP